MAVTSEPPSKNGPRYSGFHAWVQGIASTYLGTWVLSRIMHALDHFVLRASGGCLAAATWLAGLPIAVVEVQGARSGKQRTVPLICVRTDAAPDKLALIATNWGRKRNPAWYYNLKTYAEVSCTVNGRRGDYRAYEAESEEYQQWWQAGAETYVGYEVYRRRIKGRAIPIMVLEPVTSPPK